MYASNKKNEIEGLLLSLVMDNQDETLKLQYESELEIQEANGPKINSERSFSKKLPEIK